MLHKVWYKKSQDSRNSKMIEKVETGTINRERRKTMIAILEVEVATNITHINFQQTSPLKMIKKLAYTS